jgi:ribonuclease-3
MDACESYERLEFLGDALLGFLVSDRLCREDPDAREGVLTRRKQVMVRTTTLARVARNIGLGEALRLGKGEESSGGRKKPSLLADAFEAVLGAIYLDGGIRPSRSFVRRHLKEFLAKAGTADLVPEDFKTRLQELAQARLRLTPDYRIVSITGPDHELLFEAEVHVGDAIRAQGRGASRKQAEQRAASEALKSLMNEEN